MASFSFTLPNGRAFEVKGPPGLSLEQARAIFDKQASAGSLVGVKPGDVISAATQAAQGLAGAQAALAQAQSGITGALGAGIAGAAGAIGSISSAAAAAGGALNGSLSGIASGLTGAVGQAVSNIPGGPSAVTSAVSTLTGTVSAVGSTASSAIGTINRTLSSAVTNPINIADFAKELPAVTSLGSLAQGTVTGVLAQAKKLVGQAGDVITNDKGLGSFGLDAEQLERAGVIKPGLAVLVKSGASTLTNLLKSPAAFTGKDGIKSAADLLTNPQKQTEIQQNLMSQGLAGLKSLGVPTDVLSPQGLAGTALNAAKSIPGAAEFLKNGTVPGDPTGALKQAFQANIRDGAFAATLSQAKIPPAFKAEVIPIPAIATVARDTVNAASARVVGNDKVPEPNYGPPTPPAGLASQQASEIQRALEVRAAIVASTESAFATLEANLAYLETQQTITDQQYEAIVAERTAARNVFNSRLDEANRAAELINAALEEVRRQFLPEFRASFNLIEQIRQRSVTTKSRIAELAKKRQDAGTVTT